MIEVRLTTLGYTRVTREDGQDYTILALPRDGTDVTPLNDHFHGEDLQVVICPAGDSTPEVGGQVSSRTRSACDTRCLRERVGGAAGLRSGWVLDISRWLCPKMR